jgi:hypothetical protein
LLTRVSLTAVGVAVDAGTFKPDGGGLTAPAGASLGATVRFSIDGDSLCARAGIEEEDFSRDGAFP